MNKTYQIWQRAKDFCIANPGKSTIVKMIDGHFTMTWTPSCKVKHVDECDRQSTSGRCICPQGFGAKAVQS